MQELRSQLEAVHPSAPWLALTLLVFLAIYGVRKYAPNVWLVFEAQLPDKRVISNVLQALPAVLLGALASTFLEGGDFAEAWKGALFGAVAPIVHWALRLSPLPYQGALGETKPNDPNDDDPPISGVVLVHASS